MSFKNIPIVVYPELVGPAIANKEDDLLVIYLVLKSFDANLNNHTGVVEMKTLLKAFLEIMGVQKQQAYKRIEKGIGTYWHKPGGKNPRNKKVGLKHINAVWNHLSPSMARSKPFSIPFENFHNPTEHQNRTYIKRMLISLIAGRHSDFRPQSIESISKEARVSNSTVKRALDMPHVVKQHNFQKHYEGNSIYDAVSVKNALAEAKRRMFWIYQGEKPMVLSQIGNSYSVPWERLPMKKRPEQAKVYDSVNLPTGERVIRYLETEKSKKTSAKNIVSPVGYLTFPKLRKVKLWQQSDDDFEPNIVPVTRFESVTELYQKVFSTV